MKTAHATWKICRHVLMMCSQDTLGGKVKDDHMGISQLTMVNVKAASSTDSGGP